MHGHRSFSQLSYDGKKLTDMDLPFIQRVALKEVLKKIEGTDLEKFLKEYNAI